MRHDGFLGNVGKWVLPMVLLGLVIACSQRLLPVTVGEIDEFKGIRKVENPPNGPVAPDNDKSRPDPPVDDTVYGDSDDSGPDPAVPDVEPAPGPSVRPSSKPGAGRKPATRDAEDDEPGVASEAPALNADDYKVTLDVTKSIELHNKGDLRVWIGLENYVPGADADMVRNMTSMPADIGNYARITPYAPDFRVEPEESQVMRIVPSGSSVLFTIIPEKKGEFKISARIELFDNPYFEGVPIPKTSDIVSVVVTVDNSLNVKSRLGELGTVVWDNFIRFWGAFVALFFGAVLFLIRKFVRKRTGFTGDGIESTSVGGGSDADTGGAAEGTETSEEGGGTDDGEEEESDAGEEEEGIDFFDVGDSEE